MCNILESDHANTENLLLSYVVKIASLGSISDTSVGIATSQLKW